MCTPVIGASRQHFWFATYFRKDKRSDIKMGIKYWRKCFQWRLLVDLVIYLSGKLIRVVFPMFCHPYFQCFFPSLPATQTLSLPWVVPSTVKTLP